MNTLLPKASYVTKRNIQLWIDELRAGKYKQVKNKLQKEDGFCCLGVACKVFIPDSEQDRLAGDLTGNLPHCQSNAPKWLKQINSNFSIKTGIHLHELNDGFCENGNFLTETTLLFDEIADLLQAVYIEKVLDWATALTVSQNTPLKSG